MLDGKIQDWMKLAYRHISSSLAGKPECLR